VLIQDHAVTAEDFLAASDREFAAGDVLQASEKLWGAAAHAITAVAKESAGPGSWHPPGDDKFGPADSR
jgi:hypothetical protein